MRKITNQPYTVAKYLPCDGPRSITQISWCT